MLWASEYQTILYVQVLDGLIYTLIKNVFSIQKLDHLCPVFKWPQWYLDCHCTRVPYIRCKTRNHFYQIAQGKSKLVNLHMACINGSGKNLLAFGVEQGTGCLVHDASRNWLLSMDELVDDPTRSRNSPVTK